MDEFMRKKEMNEIQANAGARKQVEDRMMANLNGTSQSNNSNHQLEEDMRKKEMNEIQADADARKQEEDRKMAMEMAIINGTFDYSDNAPEKVVNKRR